MLTKVYEGEYNGKPMFEIWQVDENDNKLGDRPKFNFGITKAQLILQHEQELKDYVNKYQRN